MSHSPKPSFFLFPERGVIEEEVRQGQLGHVKYKGASWEAILYTPQSKEKQLPSTTPPAILKPGTIVTIVGNIDAVLIVTYREITVR